MIIANIQRNEKANELAIKSYKKAIAQFEAALKVDSDDIGFRRRLGHVYDLVGNRHLALAQHQDAAECFASGARHLKVVLDSPFDPDYKESDLAGLTRLRTSAAKAFEHSGDMEQATLYRTELTQTEN